MDDDVSLVVRFVRAARDRGYEATGTIDPADVMPKLDATAIDVVLLDIRMPRVDGRDLLPRIVQHPSAPSVVVMSGWIDELLEDLCYSYGATDVVRKPFPMDALFRRIDAASNMRPMSLANGTGAVPTTRPAPQPQRTASTTDRIVTVTDVALPRRP